jgi:RHS repeat-associated protein
VTKCRRTSTRFDRSDRCLDNVKKCYSNRLSANGAVTVGAATTNTSYVYGDLLFGGTAPVEQISGSTASFLVPNQTGVQGVFSSTGSALELALYSLYGNQSLVSGSRVTLFGFQGSYTDPTGLIYLINRYYDPSTDQFLSNDPDVATTNQAFVFTNDNPLNSTEPLGLKKKAKPVHSVSSSPYNNYPTFVTTKSVTVDDGSLTITYSATVTVAGPHSNSNVTIDQDGNVTVTNHGASASFSSDGAVSSLFGNGATGSASQTMDVGQDRITTTMSVTIGSVSGGLDSDQGYALSGATLFWLGKLLAPACGPVFLPECAIVL